MNRLSIPSSRRWVQATAASLALAMSADAVAAPPSPKAQPGLAESLVGDARAAYMSGKLLTDNGDFEGALRKYRQAYDLSKDPRLLFNMAVCEKNLRHYARTQDLLKQYVRESGANLSADDRAVVDRALAAIQNLVGFASLGGELPPGTEVDVDGKSVGTAPLAEPLTLDLGTHTVRLASEGYQPAEMSVDISGGASQVVTFELRPVLHIAHLVVDAGPGGAIVVDRAQVARDRFDGDVTAGSHDVEVTASGMKPFHEQLQLKDGETRTLDVTLAPESHGGPVWPWVVGGVVVAAGAAVGGYFLFKPQDRTERIPPGGLAGVQLASWGAR